MVFPERVVGWGDGVAVCARTGGAGGAGDAARQRAGRFGVEGVVVDVGHAPVEGDRLVDQRQRDGEVGVDEAEFAGGHGNAGLPAAIDTMRGCGASGRADRDAEVDGAQRTGGAGEFQLVGFGALGVGGVQEFRARGLAAGAAVVVGRVGVGQPDEQHAVERGRGVGRRRRGTRSRRAVSCRGRASTPPVPRGRPGRRRARFRETWARRRRAAVRRIWGAVMAAAAISCPSWRISGPRRSANCIGAVGGRSTALSVMSVPWPGLGGCTRRRGRRRRTRRGRGGAGRRLPRRGRRARSRAGRRRAGRCRCRR
jgi:hypothetical protein